MNDKFYVSVIKSLYGQTIYVDEAMISDEVVEMVDKMLNEIKKCNLRLGIFTVTVNALADTLHDTWKTFGVPDPQKLIEDVLKDNKGLLKGQLQSFGVDFAKSFAGHWLDVLLNHRQARLCVLNTARHYKSPLAMALLGI